MRRGLCSGTAVGMCHVCVYACVKKHKKNISCVCATRGGWLVPCRVLRFCGGCGDAVPGPAC
mgnify:CR=1 FL=1